ncbi:MAG: hypothetical protein IJ349_09030 [Clostridia bacterium]|nr:hypothetical protein [Clostridia bacterium]
MRIFSRITIIETEPEAPDEPAGDTDENTSFFKRIFNRISDFFKRIINFFTGLFK